MPKRFAVQCYFAATSCSFSVRCFHGFLFGRQRHLRRINVVANCNYWTMSTTSHGVGGAAENQAAQAALTVGADDDELCAPGCGAGENLIGGTAFAQAFADDDTVDEAFAGLPQEDLTSSSRAGPQADTEIGVCAVGGGDSTDDVDQHDLGGHLHGHCTGDPHGPR